MPSPPVILILRRRAPARAPSIAPVSSPTVALLVLLRRRLGPTAPPAPTPTIRAALVAALMADPTVASLVEARVMPGIVTEKTLKPAVAVHLLNDSPGRNLSGPDGTSTARVQFTSVSKLLTDDEAVAEAVRNLADGLLNANLGGLPILFAILDPEADDYTDVGDGTGRAVIRTTMTYLIRYRKPKPVRA
jgi:hypothetical protein